MRNIDKLAVSGNEKYIYVHGYKLPVGSYEVDLSPEKEIPSLGWPPYSYLHVDEDGTCKLEYNDKGTANIKDDYYDLFIDKNCDGIDFICKWDTANDRYRNDQDRCPMHFHGIKWQGRLVSRGYLRDASKEMLRAIRDLNPKFTFGFPECSEADLADLYNSKPRTTASVYFETAKFDLSEDAKLALNSFVSNYDGGPIIIEGYCDHRGSSKYNFQLGIDRANATKEYILNLFAARNVVPPNVSIVSFGETRSSQDSLEKDRRTTVIVGQKYCHAEVSAKREIIKRALKHASADVYLIDASNSMSRVWDLVRTNRFSKNSKIYSFNECLSKDGVFIEEGVVRSVQCNTPLWDSIVTTLEKMEKGDHLYLLSDGMDTCSISNKVDDVIRLAKKKKIKISIAYIYTNKEYRDIMLKIAQETGGAFYIEV